MKEEFLHFLWMYKKFNLFALKTIDHETITILNTGQLNRNSGPDFFNAQLLINGQRWAGNVEMHIKSSDWYAHHHQEDKVYDSVILHVVWHHDAEVFRTNDTKIPSLELKPYISENRLANYKKLFNKTSKWINCETDFAAISNFTINHWLERLYVERLQRKSESIEILLTTYNNDWEAVLFNLLAKNFGLKLNDDAFYSIAKSIGFSIFRKHLSKIEDAEALLFGQAGLLNGKTNQDYVKVLKTKYRFLKQKFNLSTDGVTPVRFFRLRPSNFPTIRLAQLASLYVRQKNLFSKLIEENTLEGFYSLCSVEASTFWNTHYTFAKTSKHSKKNLTKSFINLLLINTIIPLKFSYAKYLGQDISDELMALAELIPSEKNRIVNTFNSLKNVSNSALKSQALLELKNNYCTKNKCLKCAIGNVLLK